MDLVQVLHAKWNNRSDTGAHLVGASTWRGAAAPPADCVGFLHQIGIDVLPPI